MGWGERKMMHWLLDVIADKRRLALIEADYVQSRQGAGLDCDEALLRETASALEIAVLDLEVNRLVDDPDRRAAADAYRLLSVLPLPTDPIAAGAHLLRASVLALLGGNGVDAVYWLRTLDAVGHWPVLPLGSHNWGVRCRATVIDVWLRLVRQKGWDDLNMVLSHVAALRRSQKELERDYLHSATSQGAKQSALELIAIYHLAKAAEILAQHILDSEVNSGAQVQILLDTHFDRAINACDAIQPAEFGPMTRLLARAAVYIKEEKS